MRTYKECAEQIEQSIEALETIKYSDRPMTQEQFDRLKYLRENTEQATAKLYAKPFEDSYYEASKENAIYLRLLKQVIVRLSPLYDTNLIEEIKQHIKK